MSAPAAIPEHSVGSTVRYVDHHGRLQTGSVLWIEARWFESFDGQEARITYALRHPTYRNNRFYAGVQDIKGEA